MSAALHKETAISGVGIGFRSPHLADLLAPDNTLSKTIPWLEVLADNYLNVGGVFAAHLKALAEHYPITFHCVGMSIGSADGLNIRYLQALKDLADKHQVVWVSDHLSWSNFQQTRSHDLLPLEYTDQTLRRMVADIQQAQDILERPLMLENISAYFAHPDNAIEEADFIRDLCQASGCSVLLDLNNLFVNHKNLDYNMASYLNKLPANHIKQVHLGGHEQRGELLVDTHGSTICEPVWTLYKEVMSRFGPLPTLIEWDNNIPELAVLLSERQKAEQIMQNVLHSANKADASTGLQYVHG